MIYLHSYILFYFSEMYLGPVPDGFNFVPRHVSNAYPAVGVEGVVVPPVGGSERKNDWG
jgi:hypothetical protein